MIEIDEIIETVRAKLAEMSPDDRLGLMDKLINGYCQHCGRPESEGDYCQCMNDE